VSRTDINAKIRTFAEFEFIPKVENIVFVHPNGFGARLN
jgi:hypothetical protein